MLSERTRILNKIDRQLDLSVRVRKMSIRVDQFVQNSRSASFSELAIPSAHKAADLVRWNDSLLAHGKVAKTPSQEQVSGTPFEPKFTFLLEQIQEHAGVMEEHPDSESSKKAAKDIYGEGQAFVHAIEALADVERLKRFDEDVAHEVAGQIAAFMSYLQAIHEWAAESAPLLAADIQIPRLAKQTHKATRALTRVVRDKAVLSVLERELSGQEEMLSQLIPADSSHS